jgi:NAD(P)-dependent dehydrogenase (short-subunit alcohol dehydrogenase family)
VGDLDLTNQCESDVGPFYSASKAALNIIVAKFNAEYKKEGILFLSISPGLVEVGRYANGTYLSLFPALAETPEY